MLNPTQPAPQQQPPSNTVAPAEAPRGAEQNQQAAQGQTQTTNGQYDPSIATNLEQHLNSLPNIQKAFVNQYLTPETVTLLGIIGGAEVYDYFKKYTDPSKMAMVVDRKSQAGGGQALQNDQNAENAVTPPGNSQNAEPQAQPQQPNIAPTQVSHP